MREYHHFIAGVMAGATHAPSAAIFIIMELINSSTPFAPASITYGISFVIHKRQKFSKNKPIISNS